MHGENEEAISFALRRMNHSIGGAINDGSLIGGCMPDLDRTRDTSRHGAIGVILDAQSRFLVIERSQFVRAPGRLCFPGGGIEPGETQEAALARELMEELSLEVAPVRKLWENQTPSGTILHWWLADVLSDATPTPDLEEVSNWFWMAEAEFVSDPRTLVTNLEFMKAVRQGNVNLGHRST